MLEPNRDSLQDIDCMPSEALQTNYERYNGRLMLHRLNRLDASSEKRHYVNYMSTGLEADPFSEPSLIDPVYSAKHEKILFALNDMLSKVISNGLPSELELCHQELVERHRKVFRTSFSSGLPVKFPPLKINLFPDAKAVLCLSRNYSHDQLR